ncbi:hypothetical protein [Brevibacillus laterosporus]|uniref:hypothetical protein n=1 Tax=Brevibacillus laterosporus TaxID=1465 RepID=UPI000E6CC404|nr:hypothetical protein [Brevibacillus laterosporus]AYB38516.1 hypothetical protein D5F52_09735 [Brevibacillus laterosporus]MBM7111473.1 hypothetical protein [Brevibacillus laterosporus]
MQEILFSIVVILLITLIAFFGISSKKKKLAREKAIGAYESANCFHEYGISQLQPREKVDIFLMDEKVAIKSKDLVVELPIERIIAAQYLRKTDILKESKSAIARGIVGGVLIGPLGAIVGGVSGVGDKHKKGNYLVINYTTADSNETKVLIFDMILYQIADKLAKDLTKQIRKMNTNNGVIQL